MLIRGHPCVSCHPSGFLPSDGDNSPGHGLVSPYVRDSRWGGISQELVVAGWNRLHHVELRSTEDRVEWGLNVDHEELCDDVQIGANKK